MPTPRIAFLIEAHNDAPQLERLCRRLSGHAIFVHVDQKSKDFPIQQIDALPGVTIVQPRTPVYWADYSQIEATLTMLKVARQTADFDRFVLISGVCYPVKPIAALEVGLRSRPPARVDRNHTHSSRLSSSQAHRPPLAHETVDQQRRSRQEDSRPSGTRSAE